MENPEQCSKHCLQVLSSTVLISLKSLCNCDHLDSQDDAVNCAGNPENMDMTKFNCVWMTNRTMVHQTTMMDVTSEIIYCEMMVISSLTTLPKVSPQSAKNM